jgi:hypothetical protein
MGSYSRQTVSVVQYDQIDQLGPIRTGALTVKNTMTTVSDTAVNTMRGFESGAAARIRGQGSDSRQLQAGGSRIS